MSEQIVYWVQGPPGGGPWFDAAKEAAEFINDDQEDEPEEERVEFTSPDLRCLQRPGDRVEIAGWSITVRTVTPEEYEREWVGW